ncbi:speriolin-like protein isoform X2 [Branchiostoma floridae x Branchiostoma japonicum]
MDSRARRTSETHDVREARLLGEVCHQLEQRVLVSVFPRQKIDPASFSLRTIGDLVRLERDPDEKEFLTRKLGRVTATLRLYGFDFQRHPFFMTDVMLRFGKFPTDWDKYNFVHQKGYHDPDLLREAVGRLVPEPFRYDMLVVLDCLLAMAREDGCSIFLW